MQYNRKRAGHETQTTTCRPDRTQDSFHWSAASQRQLYSVRQRGRGGDGWGRGSGAGGGEQRKIELAVLVYVQTKVEVREMYM